MTRYYTYDRPFTLESGETLPSVTIAYDTYGEMNSTRSNVIWVCHALTANSDVADWWPHTVERGKFLDPDRYFTVCANFLGSHYGTTGPLSINPATGEPWYGDFPKITVRDMVRCHMLLAEHLGIGHRAAHRQLYRRLPMSRVVRHAARLCPPRRLHSHHAANQTVGLGLQRVAAHGHRVRPDIRTEVAGSGT